MRTTANKREIENFTTLAGQWWDEDGPMKPLHALNPVRLGILKRWIGDVKGKSILDVGCGGGIVCEPLARLGGNVTGIDAGAENIEAARAHAKQSGLDITYEAMTAEDLLSSMSPPRRRGSGRMPACAGMTKEFDAVLALEIIEHVDNPELFVEALAKLAKPGGTIIFSTINRTAKSLALAKVAAEYILRWVPVGTHDWRKFRKPSELGAWLNNAGANVTDMMGLVYDPLRGEFRENARDTAVNYFLCARRD